MRGCRLRPAFKLCLFEEEYCFDLFGYLFPLPFMDRWMREPREIMEAWGAYYSDRAFVWNWGNYSKFFYMPWMLTQVKCEVLRPDGTWVPYVGCYERDKEPDGRWQETYPYRYTLRSGVAQERTATIYVERREWRQRWLKWCPLFALCRKSIEVTFNDEVGERTGSWKGGVVGTGCEMRKGESPEDTLRRMERERKL